MSFDDLPLIRIKPVPTDAELAAERDAKYQAEINNDNDWPITEVIG